MINEIESKENDVEVFGVDDDIENKEIKLGIEQQRAFDKIEKTVEMIQNGVIAASICQKPRIQGSLPLQLLFEYLTTGETPKKEFHYMEAEIRIKENI